MSRATCEPCYCGDPECGRCFPKDYGERDDTCPVCLGTGLPSSGPVDRGWCHACGGSGVARPTRSGDFDPPPDPCDDGVDRDSDVLRMMR